MIIEFKDGKFGNNDKIIMVTTDDKEKITIFKVAQLVNQLAWNELEKSDGKNRYWVKRQGPESLYFRSAIMEAIDQAIDGVNWAEEHNSPMVVAWAERWRLRAETIEEELRRTYQMGIDKYVK